MRSFAQHQQGWHRQLIVGPDNGDVAVVEANSDSVEPWWTRLPGFHFPDDSDCVCDCALPICLVDGSKGFEMDVAVGRLPDVLARPISSVVGVESGSACHVDRVPHYAVLADQIGKTKPQAANLVANTGRVNCPPVAKSDNVIFEASCHERIVADSGLTVQSA